MRGLGNALKALVVGLWVVLAAWPGALWAGEAGRGQAPSELSVLREGKPHEGAGKEENGPVRERALSEMALGAGIQAGARWRYGEILREVVGPREKLLDEIFDFGPLVTTNGKLVLVPPVAAFAGEALRLSGPKAALGQDGSYSLVSEARLSGLAPDWRHYLLGLPRGPSGIHEAYLPKGGAELKKWRSQVDRGWQLGIEQADRLFASNLATLSRDYVGMMIFKRLIVGKYAKEAGTTESVTDLEVKESEIVFRKTLYRLVGKDGFVAPRGGEKESGKAGKAKAGRDDTLTGE
ncbi:MAG: type IV secretion system DotC family protein [Deltaproteobacteria bacterium]|jgi:defect-in-organelle-trafficking protein DotC|nr:type IV secretion system DotC family protein [Deltaproteobacteria bacterium]